MASLSYNVLRLRDFRFMLMTRMCALMALRVQAVIVGWQVYSLTKDPLILGFTGLAEAIPAITCALFSGHIVDISRPHRVYITCIGALVINTLGLLLFAGGIVALPAGNLIPVIFLGIFISGICRSFIMPSSYSLLPQVVGRSELAGALAWSSSGFQLAAIGGPALAGLVYGGYGAKIAWFLPVSLMAIAFLTLSGISREKRNYRSASVREPALQSIKAGWSFMLHNRVLLSVMALDMFAVLFGGVVAMLPVYADRVLHVGPQGLGILNAAPAAGAVASSLLLSLRPMKKIRAVLLLQVVAGFGFCMIGFGLSTVFVLSVAFLIVSGALDSVSVVVRSTLVQLITPDTMRGRVSAVNSMFIISSNEIGAFESGLAARLLGLVPSVVFGGLCTLGVVAVTACLSPPMRHMVVDSEDAPKKQ
jgi:MFS family permease